MGKCNLILALVMAMVFFSCSSNDSDGSGDVSVQKSLLAGNWNVTSLAVIMDSYDSEVAMPRSMVEKTLEKEANLMADMIGASFDEDGTGAMAGASIDWKLPEEGKLVTENARSQSGHLKMYGLLDQKAHTWEIVSISDSRMELTTPIEVHNGKTMDIEGRLRMVLEKLSVSRNETLKQMNGTPVTEDHLKGLWQLAEASQQSSQLRTDMSFMEKALVDMMLEAFTGDHSMILDDNSGMVSSYAAALPKWTLAPETMTIIANAGQVNMFTENDDSIDLAQTEELTIKIMDYEVNKAVLELNWPVKKKKDGVDTFQDMKLRLVVAR
ncbi:hypothetical protein FUAX_35870 [Fulvitalea axinellae]|uniref:Lipocalin-like domain-containing protein n=1 Tax=Fulvitalea axinellae TaxID=1182444 RepID=A0AAU9DJ21_9BACT|nr:hypothetical protein FUAX_35870 [Fulvitalea axinellae]